MGLESYFIVLLPEKVRPAKKNKYNAFEGCSDMLISDFIRQLKDVELEINILFKDSVLCELAVDNMLKMSCGIEQNYLREIIIEGCFASFQENIQFCFHTASIIHNKIISVSFYHPAIGYSLGFESQDEFIDLFMNIYINKIENFRKTFGDVKFKSLPGTSFYNALRKHNRKKVFLSLFKRNI